MRRKSQGLRLVAAATFGALWIGLVLAFVFGGHWSSAATLVVAPAVGLYLLAIAWALALPSDDSEGEISRLERILRLGGSAVLGILGFGLTLFLIPTAAAKFGVEYEPLCRLYVGGGGLAPPEGLCDPQKWAGWTEESNPPPLSWRSRFTVGAVALTIYAGMRAFKRSGRASKSET